MGGCGDTLEEGRWGSNFSDRVFEVGLDLVRKCGHICEMGDAVVFAIGDG